MPRRADSTSASVRCVPSRTFEPGIVLIVGLTVLGPSREVFGQASAVTTLTDRDHRNPRVAKDGMVGFIVRQPGLYGIGRAVPTGPATWSEDTPQNFGV